MSRIGKLPVEIPEGVQVTVENNEVTVKGPKGTLSRKFHEDIIIKTEDSKIIVERPSDQKNHRALHGLTRSLISNMIAGVGRFEKACS